MKEIESLSIDPTYKCNEKCISCACEKISHHISDSLSINDYKRVINEFSVLGGENVFVFGGEPLLCKSTVDILRIAKDKSLFSSITTNGTLLSNERICTALINSNVDQVIISIMGLEDNYERLHGKPYFSELTKGINSLLWKVKDKECNVSIHVTIQNMNCQDLPDIVKYAKNVGIKSVTCQYVSFVPDEIYQETEKRLNTELDKNLSHWTLNRDILIQPERVDACIESIHRAEEFAEKNEIDLVLDPVFYQNNRKEVLTSGVHKPKGWCKLNDIVVLPDGNVGCCSMMQHYIIGNIKEQSLTDIVKSDRFQLVKKQVEKGFFLPVCSYCCKHSMYYT